MTISSTEQLNPKGTTIRARAAATISLALALAVCLCLMFGGAALASGAANPRHDPGPHAAFVATSPAEHALESASVVIEKMTERAAEPRAREQSDGDNRPPALTAGR